MASALSVALGARGQMSAREVSLRFRVTSLCGPDVATTASARSKRSHPGYFGVRWPHWSTSPYMLVLRDRRIPLSTAGILFYNLHIQLKPLHF